jgi:hypothetical protein
VEDVLDLQAGRAAGCELFNARPLSRRCVRGRIFCGAPSWAAATWLRLAIKPIAMRLEKTINSFNCLCS